MASISLLCLDFINIYEEKALHMIQISIYVTLAFKKKQKVFVFHTRTVLHFVWE